MASLLLDFLLHLNCLWNQMFSVSMATVNAILLGSKQTNGHVLYFELALTSNELQKVVVQKKKTINRKSNQNEWLICAVQVSILQLKATRKIINLKYKLRSHSRWVIGRYTCKAWWFAFVLFISFGREEKKKKLTQGREQYLKCN